MGGVYRNAEGQERYVFDDQRAAATAAGFTPRDEQSFTDDQGDVTTMSPAEAEAAFGQRVAPELSGASDEQLGSIWRERNLETAYGGVGAGAEALGLGFARGATFGLSDLLGNPETLKAYQEAHPGLDMLGNIAGGIATGAATGLTAGAASLGARLAPGSKAAAAMIAGSAEGAAFGAGQGLSNVILKNEPLTAESVFAEMGTQIFLGAGAGAAGGLVGEGLSRGGNKLVGAGSKRLDDAEGALAANSDVVALDSAKGRVLTEDFVGGLSNATKIADDLAERAVSKAAVEVPPETFVRSFRLSRQMLDDNLETAVARAQAGELPPEVAQVVKVTQRKARRLYSELQEPLDALGRPKVASRGGTAAAGALDEGAQRTLAKKLVEYRNLAREFDGLKLGPGAGVAEPIEEVAALERFAAGKSSAALSDDAGRLAKEYTTAKDEVFSKLFVRNGAPKKRQLDVLAEMDVNEVADVARAYSRMTQAAERMAGSMGSDFMAQAAKLTDELKRAGGAMSAINKAGSGGESFSAVQAIVAMGLSQEVLPDIDGPADEILSLWLAAKMGKGAAGARAGTAAKAAKRSGMVNWVRSAGRGAGYEAAASGTSGVMRRIFGATGSHATGHVIDGILGSTAGLARTTSRAVGRTEQVVGKLVAGAGKVARKAAPFSPNAFLKTVKLADEYDHDDKATPFERVSAEVRANVANSYGMQKTVLRNLGELAMTHPGVADKTIAQADRVMKFLGTKLPRDPGTVMRFGRSAWKANDQDIAKFARYTRAALDPIGELERFAEGDLSVEGAETLRVLYPAKFAKFQEAIAANLPVLQQKLSNPEQNQLSILFGVPVNSLMEPANVRRSQATFAADGSSQPVSQTPPGVTAPTPLSPAQELLTR